MKLINNDCIIAMKEMPENSVDSIVTDPPYELGFMGKSWDSSGIAFNVDVWQEALRVLKPGGHLIAFSGSRTYHRMAVAIEDAGFEIRDQIMWVYGSGFPKSHNVSKGIDKNNGEADRLIRFTLWMRTTGLKVKDVTQVLVENDLIGENGTIAGHYFAMKSTSQPAIPTVSMWKVIRPLITDVPEWVDELVDRIEAEREVVGTKFSGIANKEEGQRHTIGASKAVEVDITISSTPAAKQWDGWGTALKPAHEPMVLARKPLIGTVANNVLTFGTGGLNIDGSRVGYVDENDGGDWSRFAGHQPSGGDFQKVSINKDKENQNERVDNGKQEGRWPANFIHDGSDEVSDLLGEPARFFYCAKASKRDRNEGLDGFEAKRDHDGREDGNPRGSNPRNRTNDKKVNHHPTVKPTSLMQYLVRLVTPPNGTVLDPFMGSGSTGKACAYEGFDFIGIEQSAEYVEIAKARIDFALNNTLPLELEQEKELK